MSSSLAKLTERNWNSISGGASGGLEEGEASLEMVENERGRFIKWTTGPVLFPAEFFADKMNTDSRNFFYDAWLHYISRNELSEDQAVEVMKLLLNIQVGRIVVDEAHFAKNPKSTLNQMIRMIPLKNDDLGKLSDLITQGVAHRFELDNSTTDPMEEAESIRRKDGTTAPTYSNKVELEAFTNIIFERAHVEYDGRPDVNEVAASMATAIDTMAEDEGQDEDLAISLRRKLVQSAHDKLYLASATMLSNSIRGFLGYIKLMWRPELPFAYHGHLPIPLSSVVCITVFDSDLYAHSAYHIKQSGHLSRSEKAFVQWMEVREAEIGDPSSVEQISVTWKMVRDMLSRVRGAVSIEDGNDSKVVEGVEQLKSHSNRQNPSHPHDDRRREAKKPRVDADNVIDFKPTPQNGRQILLVEARSGGRGYIPQAEFQLSSPGQELVPGF
ncbi:hypothetical protein FCOIX_1795 [Fusarium coicis]|nr:hypothetical protein FCOIX_1795 [Fusarium coicis]